MAAAVLGDCSSFEQAGVGEPGEELRDGGTGDAGAPRELGAGYVLAGDRAEREVLGHGQRWVVAGEQALDPAARQRRDGDERLGGIDGLVVDRRQKISYLN